MGAHVRPCGYDDVGAVGASLGRAFADDPIFSYMIPDVDEAERARRLAPLMAGTVRTHRLLGEVWTTDDHAAGAVWGAPGRKIPIWRELVSGIAFVRASWRSVPTGLRALQIMDKAHPKDPPHWYLATLGTSPERQGHGYGSALLAPVLDRCDHDGIPSYLESSKESNIPFYERFGYKVMQELSLGPGAPSLWPMWRDPA